MARRSPAQSKVCCSTRFRPKSSRNRGALRPSGGESPLGITRRRKPSGSFLVGAAAKRPAFPRGLAGFSLSVGEKPPRRCALVFAEGRRDRTPGPRSPRGPADLERPFPGSAFPAFDVRAPHSCGRFRRRLLCSDRRDCASGLKASGARTRFSLIRAKGDFIYLLTFFFLINCSKGSMNLKTYCIYLKLLL